MARSKTGLILITALVLLMSVSKTFGGEIHEAAKAGNLEKIKEILAADPSRLSVQDKFGYTPLHWAALMDHEDAAKYLIEKGANVKVAGLDGSTPLHSAANHEEVSVIGKMIKNGAQVNQKDAWGNTPLHIASRAGNKRSATILIFQGANIDAVNNYNWTPLHYAARAGHNQLASFLKKSDASTDIVNDEGKTPVDYNVRRPLPIKVDRAIYNEYIGRYHLGGSFFSDVWLDKDTLWVSDYGYHKLYPIGTDSFYCEKEPWTVYFSRNASGAVDSIYLSFLQRTVGGRRVPENTKLKEDKPRLGLSCSAFLRSEVTAPTMKALTGVGDNVDTVAAFVNFVLEDTPADKAGIKWGDIILSYNKNRITAPESLYQLVRETSPGYPVRMEILRNGQAFPVDLVLN